RRAVGREQQLDVVVGEAARGELGEAVAAEDDPGHVRRQLLGAQDPPAVGPGIAPAYGLLGHVRSCRCRSSIRSTTCSAMARDGVAAGEGAWRTAVTGPRELMRKSSTSEPSRSTACARTPAGARTRSAARSSGRYSRAAAANARREKEPCISRMP